MIERVALGIAALSMLGCTFAPAIGGEVTIECASADACPPGFRCVEVIGRCVELDDADTRPPEVSEVQISPNPAGPDAVVEVSFAVSEPLAFPPTVRLEIDEGVERPLEHLGELRFRYLVDRSEQQGPRPLEAVLVDRAGNVATAPLGDLVLDFAPPAVLESEVSPPFARAGTEVRVTAELSEAPAGEARVIVEDEGGARLEPVEVLVEGARLTARFLVEDTTPEGPRTARVEVADAAGNRAAAEVGGFVVDQTAPGLVSAELNLARANPGQLVRLTAVLDEPSAAPPVLAATLGEARFELELEEHAAELAVFRLLPGHGQPDGDWSLSLEGVVDAAGNESGPLPAGALTLDGTAPVLTVDARSAGSLRLGDTFSLTLSSSEPLQAAPAVTLGGVALTLVNDGGAAGPWGYEIDAVDLATTGTVLLTADAVDLAGNSEDPPPVLDAIEVDAVAPAVIDVTFTPAEARLGVNALLAVTVTEPLLDPGGAPIALSWRGADPGFVFEGTTLFTHTWSLAVDDQVPAGLHELIGLSFTDAAGNAVVLDEGDPRLPAALNVDNQPPTVSAVQADAAVYSRKAGFDLITVTAVVDDAGQDPALVEGTVGGRPMSCAVLAGQSPNVSCAYTVTADDAEGAVPVVLNAFDGAGNLGAGSTIVSLDFTPPEVLPGSEQLSIRPAPGALVDAVSALSAGGVADLSFITTEALTTTPAVGSAPTGIVGTAVVAQTTFFAFELRAGPGMGEGAHDLGVFLVDDVGNGTLQLIAPTIDVDLTAPAPPDPARLTYRRVPWGEDGATTPAFTVRGDAGAAEPGAQLIVFDDADLSTAVRLAADKVEGDGSVGAVPLPGGDRARVFTVVVDDAGNASGGAVAPGTVEWRATPGRKRAGSTLENPHLLERWERRPRFRADDDFERRRELDGAALLAADGITERIEPRPTWTPVPPRPVSINASLHVLSWDPRLGQVLRYGGQRALGIVALETQAWDGQAWAQLLVRTAPPSAREPAGFYHPLEERHFLIGGSGAAGDLVVASFDGDWTAHPSPPLANRAGPGAAFDEARSLAVVYGGSTSTGIRAETLVSGDGVDWSVATTTLDPGPRVYPELVYDPVGGRVLMYGGSDDPALWAFDGEWSIVDDGAAGPGPRSRFALGFDRARGRLVLFGGDAPGPFLDEVWEWSEAGGWVGPLVDPAGPPGLRDAALIFHPPSGELVLHGGEQHNGGIIGFPIIRAELWAWDGARFARRDDEVAGPPLDDPTFVALGPDSFLALDIESPPTEWRREAGRWAQAADPGLPASGGGALAAITGGALFFGDDDRTFFLRDGTWTEDLSAGPATTNALAITQTADGRALLVRTADPRQTWIWDDGWALQAAVPPQLTNPSLTLDEVRGEVLLFGGTSLHAFEGGAWVPRPSLPTPPVNANGRALAWDPARERVVLAGGFGPALERGRTWEFDGTAWTLLEAHQPPRGILGPSFMPERRGLIAHGGLDIGLLQSDETAIWRHAELEPALRFVARVATSARAADARDLRLTARAVARGLGTAEDGQPLEGFSLQLFDGIDWREVAVHLGPGLGEVSFETTDPLELRRFLRAGQEIDLLVTSRGPVGTGAAEVEVDRVSVELHYAEP